MSIRPSRRPTRRSTTRALEGSGSSGNARVDEILAAATAPATGFELNREAEMTALFRAAHFGSFAPAKQPSLARRIGSRLIATKAAVALTSAVLLAGGGVAFAASTGNLPEVLGGDHRSPTGAAHSSQAPGQQETRSPNGPKATSTAGPGTPSATPTPSFRGLCRAFQTAVASNPGKALDNPAFTALAAAAGGKAQMATFCVALIGEPAGKPTDGPTQGPTESAEPAEPTKTPNPNRPTALPSQANPRATD